MPSDVNAVDELDPPDLDALDGWLAARAGRA